MKLGVRYIVSAPDSDDEGVYRIESSARHKQSWANRDHDESPAQIHIVDLDETKLVDAPPEATYQRAERRWLSAYAEAQAVRPDANPEDAVARELVRLRRQVAAMESVVEAVGRWQPKSRSPNPDPGVPGSSQYAYEAELSEAFDVYQVKAALGAAQPQPRAVATLTAQEREAMVRLRAGIADENEALYGIVDGRRPTLVSAIDKLLGRAP